MSRMIPAVCGLPARAYILLLLVTCVGQPSSQKCQMGKLQPTDIKSARHRHVDIHAGMSLCLRRVSGVTHVGILLGRSRTVDPCNKALRAEQEQMDITRMMQIANNYNGSAGNIKRF